MEARSESSSSVWQRTSSETTKHVAELSVGCNVSETDSQPDRLPSSRVVGDGHHPAALPTLLSKNALSASALDHLLQFRARDLSGSVSIPQHTWTAARVLPHHAHDSEGLLDFIGVLEVLGNQQQILHGTLFPPRKTMLVASRA